MDNIETRMRRHLELHARGTTDAAYWALLDDCVEAADEIERLQALLDEAADKLSDYAELLRYSARYRETRQRSRTDDEIRDGFRMEGDIG
jgi:hypothetical protein